MAEHPNSVAAQSAARSARPGDVPDAVRRRYLLARSGPGVGFYLDATAPAPVFRDRGRRLTTDRNDPSVVRDLVAVARHRGWTAIDIRGHADFRREAWLAGRRAGLEVRGYQPTERDAQLLERRASALPRPAPAGLTPQAQARIVEGVVRARIVEPSEQARIIAAARSRIQAWLGRTAAPERRRPTDRDRG